MINHIYTLLLNEQATPITSKYEEKLLGNLSIDKAFVPIELKGDMLKLYQGLIPNSNRFAKNYIISCYLDLLHSTDLNEYTMAFDPRLTYVPGDTAYKSTFDNGISFDTIIPNDFNYTINKDLASFNITNISNWHFKSVWGSKLAVTGDTEFNINLPSPANKVDLMNGCVSMYIPNKPLDINITLKTVKPFKLKGYDDRVQNLVNNELHGLEDELFDINTKEGKTFKTLWTEHSESLYRLSGLLLAFLYKLEGIRAS